MPVPPLKFVEPIDAVGRVRDAFECTGEEAVEFLCDRWIAGEITPRFIAAAPPGGADPGTADWFAGAIILPDKWLSRRAVSEPGDDPEWQRIPGRSFPFRIDRQQLETALLRLPTGGPPPEQQWSGILPIPEAVSRAYPDLAPYIERYVAHFGDLPLREPNPGSPNGGRRVVLFLPEEDEARWDPSAEPCPEYWVPPAPGVHPGTELVRRLGDSTVYELMRKADGGEWEPGAWRWWRIIRSTTSDRPRTWRTISGRLELGSGSGSGCARCRRRALYRHRLPQKLLMEARVRRCSTGFRHIEQS